jgi:hypothetical protein
MCRRTEWFGRIRLQQTVENLDDDKVFLVHTCFAFYVLVGKQVPSSSVELLLKLKLDYFFLAFLH